MMNKGLINDKEKDEDNGKENGNQRYDVYALLGPCKESVRGT